MSKDCCWGKGAGDCRAGPSGDGDGLIGWPCGTPAGLETCRRLGGGRPYASTVVAGRGAGPGPLGYRRLGPGAAELGRRSGGDEKAVSGRDPAGGRMAKPLDGVPRLGPSPGYGVVVAGRSANRGGITGGPSFAGYGVTDADLGGNGAPLGRLLLG